MIKKYFIAKDLSNVPRNQYISLKQAAEILGCSLATIYAASYNGKLKISKDDRDLYHVLTDDLIEYNLNRPNRIRPLKE